MKKLMFALAIVLALTGCGGGGGSSSSTPPINPPPPPPVAHDQYDGVIVNHQGTFASQGNTSLEYTPSTDTLVFSTVLGQITVGPSRHVIINTVDYVVNFAPSSHILIFGAVINTNDYASWTITLVASNG